MESVERKRVGIVKSSSFLHLFARLTLNVGIILGLTLFLLELVSQVAWWNRPVVQLFDQPLRLLPLPLVTEEQVDILSAWMNNPDRYLQFDPVLGWSIRPNAQGEQTGIVYTANSAGMRSLREYTLAKPAGVIRIATFGPSFTHGDEVADEATWQVQLEQARPDLEVMNWGVGGYGTDQAFLRYQTQGAAYQPDGVIIGFEEDNLRRNVNRFRPFFRGQTDIPLTKPVFIEGENGLVLLENPFKDLETLRDTLVREPDYFLDTVCPGDFYCERARYQAMPFDLFKSFRFLRTLEFEMNQARQARLPTIHNPYVQRINWLLMQRFVSEVAGHGSLPIVLIFPERSSIEAHERGETTPYEAAVTLLRDQGLQVIDLASAFAHAKSTAQADYLDYYAHDGGHFNELGNYIVSQTILAHLCQEGILQDCSSE